MKPSVGDTFVTLAQSDPSVAILHVRGDLDHFTYLDLIAEARKLYNQGHRDLILDLSELTTIGLSGLFALYSVAMIFQGEEPADPAAGWAALGSMARHLAGYSFQHVKLLKVQPHIANALSRSGLPIYDNLALASFQEQTLVH